MDAILELLVPSVTPAPGLVDRSYTLDDGGETLRVEAMRLRWGPHLELVRHELVEEPLKRQLPAPFRDRGWTVLSVQGYGLDLFAHEAREGEPSGSGDDLRSLLRTQLAPDADWVVAFTRDDEGYATCEEGTLGDVERRLAETCASDRPPRGFIIVHRAEPP